MILKLTIDAYTKDITSFLIPFIPSHHIASQFVIQINCIFIICIMSPLIRFETNVSEFAVAILLSLNGFQVSCHEMLITIRLLFDDI